MHTGIRQMLRDVGFRADEIGIRDIASHWPFVGPDFRGTLIVGQGLADRDAEETTARWRRSCGRVIAGARPSGACRSG